MIVARKKVIMSIKIYAEIKRIKALSKNKEFVNLLKSKFGFKRFAFLNLNKIIDNINKIKFKIIMFVSLIALNNDKISKFKMINAKKAMKITKKLPLKQAIK